MKDYSKTCALDQDPAQNYTISEARECIESAVTEKEIADAFALISNKAWWVADDEYDYEEGSSEHEKAGKIIDAWLSLMHDAENKIFVILRLEGIEIPDTGQISVLAPFMERNGYYDGCGWWIPLES